MELLGKNGQFALHLKEMFLKLGFQDTLAKTLASSIELKTNTQTGAMELECRNKFYLETLILPRMAEIIEIASKTFGQKIEFSLQTPSYHQPAVQRKKPFNRTHSSIRDANDTKPQVGMEATPSTERNQLLEEIFGTQNNTKNAPLAENQVKNQLDLPPRSLLNDFTFDNFVRGQSNLVAYSACEAVAKNPGNLSNPVFVYGTSGLGKTHLLHSVGNAIHRNNPSWNILYVTSDDFMNEFIASIRFSRQEQFRQKYRNCDVLLVDDIQFLENKDTTQTEFFHTFNELYQKKKQILITSDKYPKDIPNIEERLKSRFLQGLIADIEPPGFEDRLAILEAKSKNLGLKMDQELAMHIANQVKGSVRELQGVLNTLLMNQNMTGVPATIESANQVLKRMLKINTGIPLDMPLIQKVVSQHFGIKIADMTSKNRSQKYVIPRHVAMYLAKEILQTTTTEIADAFGKKDHTTVMHALTKVKELMDSGPSMKATLQELRKKIEVDG
jgi:chromosomal replication initiator protein